jgi:hypothetical protein
MDGMIAGSKIPKSCTRRTGQKYVESCFAFRFLGSYEQQSVSRVAHGLEDHMGMKNSMDVG